MFQNYSHTPTPLYDEDDSQPLEEFAPKFTDEGWDLMIRHPVKKKSFMSERCWKPCFVRLREEDNMLRVFNAKDDDRPILEISLQVSVFHVFYVVFQGSYSLSENTLQAYDAYGKIHTVKLQHVLYKERVGIRAGNYLFSSQNLCFFGRKFLEKFRFFKPIVLSPPV